MAKLPQGPRVEIPLSKSIACNELEKQILSVQPLKMFEQPPLETWSIFYPENEKYLFQKFRETLKESFLTFNWPTKDPQIIAVPHIGGDDDDQDVGPGGGDPDLMWRSWKHSLIQNLNTHHIFAFILIPGQHGGSP